MKKKTTVKKGPLGTPLGNPLGYFNSQKAKRNSEPKQNLRKARNGMSVPYIGGTKENPSNVPPTLEQAGIKNIYQGPINEKDQKALDARFPATVFAPTPFGRAITPSAYSKSGKVHSTNSPREQGYMTAEAAEQYLRNRAENYLRSDHQKMKFYNENPEGDPDFVINDTKAMTEAEDRKMTYGDEYKKGGRVKKPLMKKGGLTRKKTIMKKGEPVKRKMRDGGTIATRGKTKYEYGNTPFPGPNQVFVDKTKTKKSGKTVTTNATNELTNSGFKPTITKTVTNKSGNSKTKQVKATQGKFDRLLRQGQRATELQRGKSKAKVGGSVRRKK